MNGQDEFIFVDFIFVLTYLLKKITFNVLFINVEF